MIFAYSSAELVLACLIALTNSAVIWVFLTRKQVRTPTNTYIFGLAVTDFLAGSVGKSRRQLHITASFRHSTDRIQRANASASDIRVMLAVAFISCLFVHHFHIPTACYCDRQVSPNMAIN